MQKSYDRKPQQYSVQEVLSQRVAMEVNRRDAKRQFGEDLINMQSLRYECFAKSTKCSFCGIEGTVFYKERPFKRQSDAYHFNLYAIDEDGSEILMTKDHINPTALGGKNDINNLQTACTRCNWTKDIVADEKIGRLANG